MGIESTFRLGNTMDGRGPECRAGLFAGPVSIDDGLAGWQKSSVMPVFSVFDGAGTPPPRVPWHTDGPGYGGHYEVSMKLSDPIDLT